MILQIWILKKYFGINEDMDIIQIMDLYVEENIILKNILIINKDMN